MIDPGKGLGGPSLAENLLIRRADPGRGRRGASGMAHRFFLLHATTEDLLRHDMEKLAAAFPQHTFRLELDGIAGFAVFVNDALLLQSDFYEVERLYRQDAQDFYQQLTQKAQQTLTERLNEPSSNPNV